MTCHRLLIISLFLLYFWAFITSALAQCLQAHHDSLLRLSGGFIFPNTSKLASWVPATDCCGWNGVTCDSGEVIGLDLSNSSISGKVDNALFTLTSLKSLNLSLNRLDNATIPSKGFERLGNLTALNLSTSGLVGQIPFGISRLTNLVSLDLSNPFGIAEARLKLRNPNLRILIQNLTRLQYLYLDGVDLSAIGNEWCNAISESVPSLRVLRLSGCLLSGPIGSSLSRLRFLTQLHLDQNDLSSEIPGFLGNLSSLTLLDLSSSNLKGSLPETIFELRNLTSLDVSNNPTLGGRLPDSIGNLKALKRLQLFSCRFSGWIPASIGNLTQLTHLDLSSNNFSGGIPAFQSSASISEIVLAHNQLSGSIPSSYGNLQNLTKIDIRNNSLNGTVPSSLFSLPLLQSVQLSQNLLSGQLEEFLSVSSSSLEIVDLGSNKLQGSIPQAIFRLTGLKILVLGSNNFSGTVDLNSIANLRNLSNLDLSNNMLTVQSRENSSASFPMIGTLKLAFCNMTNFPGFLRNQNTTNHLDLSGNKIDGVIPSWIWSLGKGTFNYLNLSHNYLTGFGNSPPDLSSSSLSVLDLHSNKLGGPILFPPPSNTFIDYSNNQFKSTVPLNISMYLNFTVFFSLSNNILNGRLPRSICSSAYLLVLDLSYNKFSGPIPPCLVEMGMLRILNLRGNSFRGTVPSNFSGGCSLRTLNLNGNQLDGSLPEPLFNCTMLEVLDLGNNQISGPFPSRLHDLQELHVLVLRSNKFSGPLGSCSVWKNTTSKLQILDLSSNQFRGRLSSDCFQNLIAMVIPDEKVVHPVVQFSFLSLSQLYYQDTVMVTSKGMDMTLMKILTIFTSIDLSNNFFEGSIPETLGQLNSLYVLNMSHNQLTGQIPRSLGHLSYLESLDLSCNMLSGGIPSELASLTFLSFLNLSNNLLDGRIPKTNQFPTFSNTSFLGNTGLCGFPLTKICPDTSPEVVQKTADSVLEPNWEFIFVGLGFGGGLGLVVGPLLVWRKGRKWFNGHVDKILWAVLPPRMWLCAKCGDGKVDAEDKMNEESLDLSVEGPQRTFCLFCTRMEFISGQVIIRHVECSCPRED